MLSPGARCETGRDGRRNRRQLHRKEGNAWARETLCRSRIPSYNAGRKAIAHAEVKTADSVWARFPQDQVLSAEFLQENHKCNWYRTSEIASMYKQAPNR